MTRNMYMFREQLTLNIAVITRKRMKQTAIYPSGNNLITEHIRAAAENLSFQTVINSSWSIPAGAVAAFNDNK